MYNCLPASGIPFWWLDTGFGMLVFILTFITWGLIIIALLLYVINQLDNLFIKCEMKKKESIKLKKKQ